MTGNRGYNLRITASVSRPSMTGISTSRVMRSGLSSGILARAIRPSLAVATTSSSGSPDNVSESTLRVTSESSTTRIRIGAISNGVSPSLSRSRQPGQPAAARRCAEPTVFSQFVYASPPTVPQGLKPTSLVASVGTPLKPCPTQNPSRPYRNGDKALVAGIGGPALCWSCGRAFPATVVAGADLELLDQLAQLCGRLQQLLRRLLGIGGSAPFPRLLSLAPILNCSTSWRSCVDVSSSCCDAFWVSVAPRVVPCPASATPATLLVISALPCAASLTLRDISLVVAFCSSTAVAIVPEMSLIWLMTPEIDAMALTDALVSVWMASILRLMSSVALAVSLANSLTSLATTAKPLPASPARAASMVALSASRLVCWAMEVMTLMTCPISVEESPSLETVAVVVSATLTAAVRSEEHTS